MDAKLNQAKLQIKQRKFKKAQQILSKLNKNNVNHLQYLELEAYCLFNLKQYKRAAIHWQHALNISPSSIHIMNNIVSSFVNAGNIDAAVVTAEKILKIDPSLNNASTYFQLTDLYHRQHNFEKVIAMAQKLKTVSKYTYEVQLATIDALINLGREDDAKHHLKTVLIDLEYYSKKQIGFIINSLQHLGLQEQLKSTLTKLDKLYIGDTWFSSLLSKPLDVLAFDQSKETQLTKSLKTPSKVLITGDNNEVVNKIEKLCLYTQKNGGKFHSSLNIVEKGGNLSITSTVKNKQRLLSIPITLMPILSDFRLHLEGNKLICFNKKNQVNPLAAPVMQMLVQIYNITNKFEVWAKNFPITRLQKHDELLELIFMPYSMSPTIQRYVHLLHSKKREQLILESFWGSRAFNFDKALMKKAGIKIKAEEQAGLLGLIDFLNHRSGVSGFLTCASTNDISIETLPDKATNEVFVEYNLEDPLKTLLIYGFVDLSSPWLFSVPVTIRLYTGRIVNICYNHESANKGGLPDKINHLAKYLPKSISREQNQVTLNMLTLPEQGKQKTLKVILIYCLFGKSNFQLSETEIKEVLELHGLIVKANLDFWGKLKVQTEQAKKQDDNPSDYIFNELDRLTEFGIKHVKSYLPHCDLYT